MRSVRTGRLAPFAKRRYPVKMRLGWTPFAAVAVLTLTTFRARAEPKVTAGFTADGQAYAGATPMKGGSAAGAPPAQAASPAAGSVLTGAAGLFGAAVGGSLVQPLPPMPKRAAIKPLEDENEKPEDPSVRRVVSSAQEIASQYSRERSRKGPPPASQAQVDATIAELTPFTTFDRTAMDRNDRKYKRCESRCGCHGKCTFSCRGTCYSLGMKDPRPGGRGIDCSGLIAQENPGFWRDAARFGPANCRLAASNDCTFGTQQQLSLLKSRGLDDIDDANDLRAGDVAYFNDGPEDKKDPPRIDHVMQVVSTPNCSTDNGHQSCILYVIHAPHAGVAVQRSQFTFLDGHVVEKDGRVIDSTLYFSAGGTPPAGPRTGAR